MGPVASQPPPLTPLAGGGLLGGRQIAAPEPTSTPSRYKTCPLTSSYRVFLCFVVLTYIMRLSGLQVHIYIHSISNMVFHKLTKALVTQKIHVQCFTECQFIVFEYIKPFYFHRTYFKGFMIYVPHLFHSYIDRTSSILSILTKLIVSCSFVTAVKFVIVKINAARKVA